MTDLHLNLIEAAGNMSHVCWEQKKKQREVVLEPPKTDITEV